ncbi:mucin-binding protein [Lacticaseibacillus daqingensis]|uniref:mucin-binding protein n=1 Tax=Lacticaseibacillus daqingensis TaxID=2486014 RepID=UPI001CDD2665|nr:LPXTG cell wall anchor domain-containing protein [Lacticaseibacillus daqingensis]
MTLPTQIAGVKQGVIFRTTFGLPQTFSINLAPTVTTPALDATTLSGTGSGEGDLISLYRDDGTDTGLTATVGSDGQWSIDLSNASVLLSEGLYVVESNATGTDFPGVAVVPRADQVTRTIRYVKADTDEVIDTVEQTIDLITTGEAQVTRAAGAAGTTLEGTSVTITRDAETGTLAGIVVGDMPSVTDYVRQVDADVPDQTVQVGDDSTITIVYYPRFVTITPDDTRGPGDPVVETRPEGPKIPTGLAQTDLIKQLTQTIRYQNADGSVAAPDRVVTLRYRRTGTADFLDLTNPVLNYAAWELDSVDDGSGNADLTSYENGFIAAVSPDLTDKVPDVPTVAAVTINLGEGDAHTQIQSPDPVTVTYYNSTIRVPADGGQTAGSLVGETPEDPRVYPATVDTASLNRTVTQTLRFVNATTGEAIQDAVTREIDFKRDATITYAYDAAGTLVATVVHDPWATDNNTFAEYPAPDQPGYQHAGAIAAVTVTEDSADLTRTIWYYPEAELAHTVTVTTTFGAPVNEPERTTTVAFSRTITLTPTADGDTIAGLSAWTLDQADTDLIAALGDDLPMPENGDAAWASGWTAQVAITANGTAIGDGSDQAVQLNADSAANDLAVALVGATTTITRVVTYTDSQIHIRYIDVDDGDRLITAYHGTATTTAPSHYGDVQLTSGVGAGQYALELVADATALAAENGTIIDGQEQFAAQAGDTITIELRHRHITASVPVQRVITYVVEDGAVPAPAAVTQTGRWTEDTDLYAQNYADQLTTPVDAVTYTQTVGFDALVTPPLAEYRPDQPQVDAVPVAAGATTTTPSDAEPVTITYRRTVFTPTNPGDKDVTRTITQTIQFVDGATGQPIGLEAVERALHFSRTVTENEDGTETSSEWVADSDTFSEYAVPDVADWVHPQASVAAVSVTADSAPLTTTVAYYPAKRTVTADDPKAEGDLTVPGDDASPTYPAGVTADALTLTVARTIIYRDALGNTVLQEVAGGSLNFIREATIDYSVSLTAPAVVYSAWKPVTTATFESFTPPTTVGEWFTLVTATPELTVDRATLTTTLPLTQPPLTQTVDYYATIVTVTPDQPFNESDAVDPDNLGGPEYPAGVAASDLNTSATQTIQFIDQVKGTPVAPDVMVTLNFTRTATVNLMTGAVEYGAWEAVTTTDYPEFTAIPATLAGLSAAMTALSAQPALVDGVPTDRRAVIPYVKKAQAVVIVEPEDPKNSGDEVFPEYPGVQVYPDKVTATDLNTTVTRTVSYWNGLDVTQSVAPETTQTLAFKRTATITYDLDDQGNATGDTQVVYSDWLPVTAAAFDAVTAPTVTGLFTTQPTVVAQALTQDQITAGTPLTEKVYYYPETLTVTPETPLTPGQLNPEDPDTPVVPDTLTPDALTTSVTETIRHVARNGAALFSETTGTAQQDTVVVLDFTRTATWNLVSGAVTYAAWTPVTTAEFAAYALPGTLYDADGTAYKPLATTVGAVQVDLTQATLAPVTRIALYGQPPYEELVVGPKEPVTETDPTGPKTPGTPTNPDDNGGQKYPEGVDVADLNRAVQVTVHYEVAGGAVTAPADQVQTLHFERSATIQWAGTTPEELNAATGVVSYAPWTAVTQDSFETVATPALARYFASQAAVTWPSGLTLVENDSEAPWQFTVTVKYYLREVTVTPDQPKDPGTLVEPTDPEGPQYPAGVSEQDLNHTVSRTITYVDAASGAVLGTDLQLTPYTRTATVTFDSLTAAPVVVYSDWTPAATALAALPAAQFAGLLPRTATVAAQAVTAADVANETVFAVVVKYDRQTLLVTPDKPVTPGTAVIPDDPESPRYPAGLTAQDLNQVATRVIRYLDAVTGQPIAPSLTVTLGFHRTATVTFDAGGNATVVYGPWEADAGETFAAVVSPVIAGKVATPASVTAETVAGPVQLTATVTYAATKADEPTKTPTPQPAPKPAPTQALPQTGEQTSPLTTALGLLLISLASLLGLAVKKRRQHD